MENWGFIIVAFLDIVSSHPSFEELKINSDVPALLNLGHPLWLRKCDLKDVLNCSLALEEEKFKSLLQKQLFPGYNFGSGLCLVRPLNVICSFKLSYMQMQY